MRVWGRRTRLGHTRSGGSPREGARSELASGAATGGGGRQPPDPEKRMIKRAAHAPRRIKLLLPHAPRRYERPLLLFEQAGGPDDGTPRDGPLGITPRLVLEAVVLLADHLVQLGDHLLRVATGDGHERFGAPRIAFDRAPRMRQAQAVRGTQSLKKRGVSQGRQQG